jgi:GNAT superfamily N-acetyltransferase
MRAARAEDFIVERFDGPIIGPIRDAVVKVYADAMMPPPYGKSISDVQMFASIIERHAERDGFRLFVARADNEVVGFSYGYDSRPGGWWREQVTEALGPKLTLRWLRDALEFTELAVRPGYQGMGIGTALHDALLADSDRRTAALSTLKQDTRGSMLYEKKGWITLLEEFWFPATPDPYRVMGIDLPPSR